MIARNKPFPVDIPPWHKKLLQMLPLIRDKAHLAFCDLQGDDYDDALQEVVANATAAYHRLVKQGRADVASATSLAGYAIRQYWDGRRTGTRSNVRDVSSAYCRRHKGVKLESLHHWDKREQAWQEVLVEDKKVTPADLAASRIDYPAWLASLSPRVRRIAERLAAGATTSEVARKFHVSRARISQIRRELMQSWHEFHEPVEREAVEAA